MNNLRNDIQVHQALSYEDELEKRVMALDEDCDAIFMSEPETFRDVITECTVELSNFKMNVVLKKISRSDQYAVTVLRLEPGSRQIVKQYESHSLVDANTKYKEYIKTINELKAEHFQ